MPGVGEQHEVAAAGLPSVAAATAPTRPGDLCPPMPATGEQHDTVAADMPSVAASTAPSGPADIPAACTAVEAPSADEDHDDALLREQRRLADGEFDQSSSRFMVDAEGKLLHKWKVDYASRGGGGRATCKDTDCLERHDQGGVRTIEKGSLRIGRRVLFDKDKEDGGHVVVMWHHARCIFNTFQRSRKNTRVIESVDDLEGFRDLRVEDQALLQRIIAGHEDLSKARFRSSDGLTPQKRVAGAGGPDGGGEGAKRMRLKEPEERLLRKGDRVWTFCRVRPPARPDGAEPPVPAGEVAIKSAKPELGMVREEPEGLNLVVQFESKEHEQERIKLLEYRKCRIRGWLKYPRLFEGKKQKLPVSWVQKRDPPRLCGCKEQSWNHTCEIGISCSRWTGVKVWGVGG